MRRNSDWTWVLARNRVARKGYNILVASADSYIGRTSSEQCILPWEIGEVKYRWAGLVNDGLTWD